jgi:hypothetical protein
MPRSATTISGLRTASVPTNNLGTHGTHDEFPGYCVP